MDYTDIELRFDLEVAESHPQYILGTPTLIFMKLCIICLTKTALKPFCLILVVLLAFSVLWTVILLIDLLSLFLYGECLNEPAVHWGEPVCVCVSAGWSACAPSLRQCCSMGWGRAGAWPSPPPLSNRLQASAARQKQVQPCCLCTVLWSQVWGWKSKPWDNLSWEC